MSFVESPCLMNKSENDVQRAQVKFLSVSACICCLQIHAILFLLLYVFAVNRLNLHWDTPWIVPSWAGTLPRFGQWIPVPLCCVPAVWQHMQTVRNVLRFLGWWAFYFLFSWILSFCRYSGGCIVIRSLLCVYSAATGYTLFFCYFSGG